MASIFSNKEDKEVEVEGKKKPSIKATINKAMAVLFSVKVLLIILTPILITILLASWWRELKEDTIDTFSGVVRKNDTSETLIIDQATRKYEMSEEFIERAKKVLEDTDKDFEIDEELFFKFYEVEIMTSFPDLRQRDKIGTAVSEGDIQGAIQIKRRYPDGTEELLEYMDYEEYRTEAAKFGNYDLLDKDGNASSQEKIYNSKNEVDNAYETIKRYFTLDSEYNLVVATITTTEETNTYSEYAKQEGNEDNYSYTYNLQIKKVNYKQSIEKYTIPIEFMLTMLTVSQNPGFCEALVDLVKESKIVIEVQDNEITTQTSEEYTYTANFKLGRKVTYKETVEKTEDETENETENETVNETVKEPVKEPPKGNNRFEYVTISSRSNTTNTNTTNNSTTTQEVTKEVNLPTVEHSVDMQNPYQPYRKTEIKRTENMVNILPTEAVTWIADYKITYSNVTDPNNGVPQEVINTVADDTDYRGVGIDYHFFVDWYVGNSYSLPEGATLVKTEDIIQEKDTNKQIKVTTTTTSNSYNKVGTQTVKKEEKFLSLLSVNPLTGEFDKVNISKNTKLKKYRDNFGKNTSPEEDIINISREIMFEFLAKYETTQVFEEIMRYLLYVYTGKSYGVIDLDFSVYDPGIFNTMVGGSALWDNSLTINEFTQKVKDYSAQISNASRKNGYDTYFIPNINNFYNIATSYGLDPRFIFCIGIHESGFGTSAIAVDKGNFFGWGAFDDSAYDSAYTFVDMSNGIDTVCKGIAQTYVDPNGTFHQTIINRGYDPSTISGVGSVYATDPNWANAVVNHMKNIFGYTQNVGVLDSPNINTNSGFLSIAKQCHDYLKDNNYYYSTPTNKENGQFMGAASEKNETSSGSCVPKPYSGEGTYIDCSAYVTWVLYEYGYTEFAGYQKSTYWFMKQVNNNYGWQYFSASQAQAGDILVRNGHMEIYAGNGRSYSCGSTTEIRQDTKACNPSDFTYAIRIPDL